LRDVERTVLSVETTGLSAERAGCSKCIELGSGSITFA